MFDIFLHRWLGIPYTLHVRKLYRVKNARATLLFIHGLGDTGDMWQSVLNKLPSDVNVVVVDLLGFGNSPRPAWSKYNARAQAESLLSTYLTLRIPSKVIVVGHSLGSLVAIEFAKRYTLLTNTLILCSPPIYKESEKKGLYRRPDDLLKTMYSKATENPEGVIALYSLARRIGVGNESLAVDSGNIQTFVATLRASIINQHTIRDISKLKMPIYMLHGLLDPFVIRANLSQIAKRQHNVTLYDIAGAHIIRGPYVAKVVKLIRSQLSADESQL